MTAKVIYATCKEIDAGLGTNHYYRGECVIDFKGCVLDQVFSFHKISSGCLKPW